MEAVIIHGTSFDVTEVFIAIEQPLVEYVAEVTKINMFGFFEVTIDGCDKKLKRHLADCYDLQGICLAGQIKGLYCKGPETYMLSVKGISEEVYFIKHNDSYLSRRRTEFQYTDDITLAWFTFDKEQAERFAMRLTMKELAVYDVASASDVITLDNYMEA